MNTSCKRVLVVDDAATVRMYHRQIVEEAGYLIDEAMNGIEGLEKALTQPFDLYLVDINMPKLDGYGFLRELRAADIPQAPAIMISTEAEHQDLVRAYEAGANYFLIKPTKPAELTRFCQLLLGTAGGPDESAA